MEGIAPGLMSYSFIEYFLNAMKYLFVRVLEL